MPSLYIITGANGAGKSTVGPDYLPDDIRSGHTIFDGDLLYGKKLSELFPRIIPSPKEARKVAFQFIIDTFEQLTGDALDRYENFVYEGHFTNHATWDTPKKFKAAGYEIHLVFFGLSDPDLSEARVARRFARGGHFVDRLTIEDNFSGNLEMLNHNFKVIDHLTIIDASEIDHFPLATLNSGKVITAVPSADLPHWFTRYMPDITALIP